MQNRKVASLFGTAMLGKIPEAVRAGWEPLLTDGLLDKATERIEGLGSMSRKQLRSLIALMEFRYYTLMTELSQADSGIGIAQVQGRLREVMGTLAFFRELLNHKEGEA